MNRRVFIRNSSLALAALGLPFNLLQLGQAADYKPIGHLHVEDERAFDVDAVYFNGEKRLDVYELNDEEGWIKYWEPSTSPRYWQWVNGEHRRKYVVEPITNYAEGVVRVTWRRDV